MLVLVLVLVLDFRDRLASAIPADAKISWSHFLADKVKIENDDEDEDETMKR